MYVSRTCRLFLLSAGVLVASSALAQGIGIPNLKIDVGSTGKPDEIVSIIKIVLMLTVLALAPSLMIMMTSFTRLVIVLSLMRQAIGVQQAPPNQVVVGLALFLTFFIMQPYIAEINTVAIQPYMSNKIEQEVAFAKAIDPIKKFMLKQTRKKDLSLFLKMSKGEKPKTTMDVSMFTLMPAFIISELKSAFQMGFMIYIPFLVIDMVVATILMAMGMMVLPPAMISLPFKLMLFVMVDGWNLIMDSLMRSFH